jgi:hypothetical protein
MFATFGIESYGVIPFECDGENTYREKYPAAGSAYSEKYPDPIKNI